MLKRLIFRQAGLLLAATLIFGLLMAQVDAQAAVAAAYGEERAPLDPLTRSLAMLLGSF